MSFLMGFRRIKMFETIYIEKELLSHKTAQNLHQVFPKAELKSIDSYTDIFGAYRKPYLQKRNRLNLFLATKKGKLIKEAPDAYGLKGEAHYYFIHAFNCIYECEYCYLQGYFDSPDIVLFVNHEDILKEMEKTLDSCANQNVWFHAGEFSDSLAMSHISGEIEAYHDFFKSHPKAKLELRTKSANTRSLLKLEPLDNRFTSFSLAPEWQTKDIEHKTASLKQRLSAMKKLIQAGHKVAVHFDPVVLHKDYLSHYKLLIEQMSEYFPIEQIEYLSLGVVRYTKEVFKATQEHYPESPIFAGELITSFDGKVRYPKPLRMSVLRNIESILIKSGLQKEKIYLCME